MKTTTIYGSVKELDFFDLDKIKKSTLLRLEKDSLKFYFPEKKNIVDGFLIIQILF
ncbi:hypothetical protein PJW08_06540 [Tenacibaculum finnmarkense]|nr:hypothetical protein PJW08_06540 [Tenacibaculum finnmarkense]